MVSHIPVLWRKGIPWHCEDLAAVGMRECGSEMTKFNMLTCVHVQVEGFYFFSFRTNHGLVTFHGF